MFYRSELEEMIKQRAVIGDTIKVIRKQGKIFDVVLNGELTRPWEVVTVEKVSDVLSELPE